MRVSHSLQLREGESIGLYLVDMFLSVGNCITLQALHFEMNDPCVVNSANNEKHKQTGGCLRIRSLDFIALK